MQELSPSERSKIASLLSKEKKGDDISWMYNPKKDDTDAFLLGKAVTSLDALEEVTKEFEETPAQKLARYDMITKFREDPLTVMKQREAQKRLELLQNTAKVKKLRRLLALQKHRKEKKHKETRLKKRNQRDRDTSSSGSSSGDELLDRFIKIVNQSDKKELELVEKTAKAETDKYEEKHPPKPNRRSHQQRPSSSYSAYPGTSNKPRLSKEELEARRAQMASDAKEHERDCLNRANDHYRAKKEEERREWELREKHGASFISKVKYDHVEKTSIEEGVHRKASRRQRGELNSNFLRR